MAQKKEIAKKLDLAQHIKDFFAYVQNNNVELYNEFSLQHELGIYLREKLHSYKVQFERNVSFFFDIKPETVKKEIDIVIYSPDEKERYAVELKYPRNGQIPEQMYAFVKDIRFVEQLKEKGFTGTCAVTLVEDKPFYFDSGRSTNDIYGYFRGGKTIKEEIKKPTGEGKEEDSILIDGVYNINWVDLDEVPGEKAETRKKRKYYIVTIG